MNKLIKNTIQFIAALVIMLGISSCHKDTTCTGVIKVIDKSSGAAIPNASVKLYAQVIQANGQTTLGDLKAEATTDGTGSTNFKFKLPAIMDIKATFGTKVGQAIIKFEPSKTNEKVVEIQ